MTGRGSVAGLELGSGLVLSLEAVTETFAVPATGDIVRAADVLFPASGQPPTPRRTVFGAARRGAA